MDDENATPSLATRSLKALRPRPVPRADPDADSLPSSEDAEHTTESADADDETDAVDETAVGPDDEPATTKRPAPVASELATREPRSITIRIPTLRRRTGTRTRLRRRTWIMAAAIGVVAIALLVTDLVLTSTVSDREDVNRARTQAVEQAAARVPKMLSYSYSSLAADLKTASAQTTGKFHTEYQQVLEKVVQPSATSKKITTKTVVTGTSVVQASASHVVVLVFLTQSTSAATGGTPLVQGSRVDVTMTKTGGTWLVSALDPV